MLKNGKITDVNHPDADKSYIGIGETDLINKRKMHEIITEDTKQEICPCCEYIPFYFKPKSVMLYRIQTGYKVKKIEPSQIIYLVFKLSDIISDIDFLFTDGHGYAVITRWFEDIANLKLIESNDLEKKIWKNTPDDQDIQRKKQAEFWVKHELDLDKILGIGVYDKITLDKVNAMLLESANNIEVKIKKNWYYD